MKIWIFTLLLLLLLLFLLTPFSLTYFFILSSHFTRGRPLGTWEDRVKEYVSERGVRGNGLEWARRECMDRKRWRSSAPLGEASGRSEASELLIDTDFTFTPSLALRL